MCGADVIRLLNLPFEVSLRLYRKDGTNDIEGEQFANAFFTLETKIKIAKAYVTPLESVPES